MRGISCTLVIVGRPSTELKELIDSSGIEFEILSGISDEALVDEYEKSDIVSFASTLEGFGDAHCRGSKCWTAGGYL